MSPTTPITNGKSSAISHFCSNRFLPVNTDVLLLTNDDGRVPFVLFGQALMFYVPYYLWKMWEGAKIRNIIQGLHIFTVKEKAEVIGEKEQILTDYIINNLHDQNRWAISYFACELMNLVNWLINRLTAVGPEKTKQEKQKQLGRSNNELIFYFIRSTS